MTLTLSLTLSLSLMLNLNDTLAYSLALTPPLSAISIVSSPHLPLCAVSSPYFLLLSVAVYGKPSVESHLPCVGQFCRVFLSHVSGTA